MRNLHRAWTMAALALLPRVCLALNDSVFARYFSTESSPMAAAAVPRPAPRAENLLRMRLIAKGDGATVDAFGDPSAGGTCPVAKMFHSPSGRKSLLWVKSCYATRERVADQPAGSEFYFESNRLFLILLDSLGIRLSTRLAFVQ